MEGSWAHFSQFFAFFPIFFAFLGLLIFSWLFSSIFFEFSSILDGFGEDFRVKMGPEPLPERDHFFNKKMVAKKSIKN